MSFCRSNCASCVQFKITSMKFTHTEAHAAIHGCVSWGGLKAIHSHRAAETDVFDLRYHRCAALLAMQKPPHQTQPKTRVFILGEN